MTPEPTPTRSVSEAPAARPAPPAVGAAGQECRSPLGIFEACPHCGAGMAPEHAHYRCTGCGWRDSCCD